MKGQPGGGGSPEGQPEEAAQQGGSQERQPSRGQPGEAARQGAARSLVIPVSESSFPVEMISTSTKMGLFIHP